MLDQILILCPSRGRPAQCNAMIDSFNATAKRSTLRLMLDMDDPCLDEYRDIIGKKCSYSIDFHKPVTQLINGSWRYSADCFKWLSVTNDDFIYKTDAWDEKFINHLAGRLGIIYGNDLAMGKDMPTTSVISREIPCALGWLQMPTLTHLYGDTTWKHIGEQAKCLFYCEEVIIEHKHYFNKKAIQDATYNNTNSSAMYDKDYLAFINWITDHSKDDIYKISHLVANNLTKRATVK